MSQLLYSLHKRKVNRILVINEHDVVTDNQFQTKFPNAKIVLFEEDKFTELSTYNSFDVLVFNFEKFQWVKDFLATKLNIDLEQNESNYHLELKNKFQPNPNKGLGYIKHIRNVSILFFVFFFGYALSTFVPFENVNEFAHQIPNEFYLMLAVGFFAQLVDGALGLGYGITCASAMMSMGIKLPAISGSIHTAEMFSSAISGYSHYRFGNVNKKMLIWLAIPGIVGAVLGSLFVIYIGEEYEHYAYPFVALYLIMIAFRLIALAFKKKVVRKQIKRLSALGFSGGFFDAFGGGGWGPIVTSTLLTKGRQSKYVIGTVSLAEFFVTFAATMTFFSSLGVEYWYIVLGLIIGGVIAAPFAARLAGKLPQKVAYILVALLVIIASVRIIMKMI